MLQKSFRQAQEEKHQKALPQSQMSKILNAKYSNVWRYEKRNHRNFQTCLVWARFIICIFVPNMSAQFSWEPEICVLKYFDIHPIVSEYFFFWLNLCDMLSVWQTVNVIYFFYFCTVMFMLSLYAVIFIIIALFFLLF